MTRRPRRFGCAAAAVAALGAAAPPAPAATADEIVASLNAQRAANGLPAGIAQRGDWSYDCYRHNEYQRQNGGALTHDEDPSRPGYTSGGAWAARNSVLHSGSGWTAENPFEHAPIHLHQLLAARLSEMGADDHDGFVCATTWPGMNRPHPADAVVYSYPGDGRTDVPAAEVARESPFVPGDFVGLPQGTRTGPHLYLMADGPWDDARARIDSASLTGPRGAEDIRWVDNFTAQIGPYLPPGGIVIPANPLVRGASYTASATITAGGQQQSRTWTFTTQPNQAPRVTFDVSPRTAQVGQRIAFISDASDPDGGPLTLSWDLDGDGRFGDAAGETAERAFATAGTHTVGLLATDPDGGSATATRSVTVVADSAPDAVAAPRGDVACLAARARVRLVQSKVRSARRAARRARSPRVRRRWLRTLRVRKARLARARRSTAALC